LEDSSTEYGSIQVTVRSVEPLGHETLVYCDTLARTSNAGNEPQGTNSKHGKTTIKFVARLSGNKAFKPEDNLTLNVAIKQIYLFDENGCRIN
jgi:ABC-type sugar transport system ATPase subunit